MRFINEPFQAVSSHAPLLRKAESLKEVREAIDELLDLGAIEKCVQSNHQYISSFFLVKKSDGSNRFVLNLKGLNRFIETKKFKLEDGRAPKDLLCPGDYLAKIDLKNAYFAVPMSSNSSRYLRFIFQGQCFQFLCLPFGLNIAPWIFTKILKPVLRILREKGLRSVAYLDDILCLGRTEEECRHNGDLTTRLLSQLGFRINWDKTILDPVQTIEFLGIIYNSLDMSLELPLKKRREALHNLEVFSTCSQCTLRQWSSFIGHLNFCSQTIKYGRLYLREFERVRYLGLLMNGDNFDAQISLSKSLEPLFSWWKSQIPRAKISITRGSYVKEIFSDASLTGWGAFSSGDSVNGFWSYEEKGFSINRLELLAAFFALQCFAGNLRDCNILLRIDNTTAIAYINKMGGIQFPNLNAVAWNIWRWCEDRNIWIFASYISSKDNVEADRESRVTNIDTEWSLSAIAFNQIVSVFGTPVVDLFAARHNFKCDKYISWRRDPGAFTSDAFTCNWRDLGFFYAFPPFAIILKSLQKIIGDHAEGIVIVPYWPNQPWFPLFNALIISEPLFLGPSPNLLFSPCRTIRHPMSDSLTLIAGVLSGKLTRGRESQHSV